MLAGGDIATMRRRIAASLLFACLATAAAAPGALAQDGPGPAEMIAAQQMAIARLAGFNGEWRGEGWKSAEGGRVTETVTQRVGSFLDGATQVIETRSYFPDGAITFHAFNNVAFDAGKAEYVMQARAGGRFGNFPFRATADGYVWELGFDGHGLRYTGTLKNGVWTEKTEQLAPDRPPETIAEFNVRRVGDTDWPEHGAMKPR
jgi:hypothetical protein